MNLSAPLPPRNRLLALEQELQARRTAAVQRQRTETDGIQAEAASITRTAAPPPQRLPIPTQKTAQSPSLWQVLAARLTQRSFPDVSFPAPKLTPPHFPSDPVNVGQEQALPNDPFPTRPIVRAPRPPVSLPPVIPSHPPDNQASTSEDAASLASWKDLASQIQQARSRSVQQSQMSHPSAMPPEALGLSVPGTQATEELLRPQPAQTEYQTVDNPALLEPPQVATDSAPSLEVIANTPTDQPSPALQKEPCETWKQDSEDIKTIDIAATAINQSEPATNAPAEAATEMVIVPNTATENDGALLPHASPNWRSLAQSLLIRAGPPELPPRPLPEMSPGSAT